MEYLFEDDDDQCREFRRNIWKYNMANAFTSVGVHVDHSVLRHTGPYCFRIMGELRHLIGSLMPENEGDARYAQLYMFDPELALEARMGNNPDLSLETMEEIQECLRSNNTFCNTFKHANEILRDANAQGRAIDVTAFLHFDRNSHEHRGDRRYSLPTSNEISVILPGENDQPEGMRDIVLRHRSGGLQRIHEGHPAYSPLPYVLLFPYGELGWHDSILRVSHDGGLSNNRVTQMDWYAYRLFPREEEYSTILRGGALLQQFICDAWAATEQNRLRYISTHQIRLRVELYGGLAYIVGEGENGDINMRALGRRIILHSSHIGSARNMFEIFQDSMAIARFFGHPDVFGTMIANPNWPEIVSSLLPGQTPADRPDLVARVFELKRQALMDDISKNHVLGVTLARVHTIEFQKRGLPHMMHFILFFDANFRVKEPEDVDRIVSAEFPDQIQDPLLFETVMSCMVHGPCGRGRNENAPCLENGVCSKKYPKEFVDATTMDGDGYPKYRRRETRRTFVKRGKVVDNRDVVPYNPFLSRKYNCHINIEICASVRAVKYIHKYIFKGHDHATIRIGAEQDEVKQYIDSRYIGAPEACWRLLGNRMHEEVPNVVRLALHLPGMHMNWEVLCWNFEVIHLKRGWNVKHSNIDVVAIDLGIDIEYPFPVFIGSKFWRLPPFPGK